MAVDVVDKETIAARTSTASNAYQCKLLRMHAFLSHVDGEFLIALRSDGNSKQVLDQ